MVEWLNLPLRVERSRVRPSAQRRISLDCFRGFRQFHPTVTECSVLKLAKNNSFAPCTSVTCLITSTCLSHFSRLSRLSYFHVSFTSLTSFTPLIFSRLFHISCIYHASYIFHFLSHLSHCGHLSGLSHLSCLPCISQVSRLFTFTNILQLHDKMKACQRV